MDDREDIKMLNPIFYQEYMDRLYHGPYIMEIGYEETLNNIKKSTPFSSGNNVNNKIKNIPSLSDISSIKQNNSFNNFGDSNFDLDINENE